MHDAAVKIFLVVIGVMALLTGLLWVGQGLGYVHWPASSFMISQRPWAYRGAGLALVGLVMLVLSLRRR